MRRQQTIADCTVSASHFTTPKRSFKIEDISLVELRRTHFYLSLPLVLGMLMLVFNFSELLHGGEMFFMLLFGVLVGGSTFLIGVIHLTGFNLNARMAAFGRYQEMEQLKALIDQSMQKSSRSRRGRRQ